MEMCMQEAFEIGIFVRKWNGREGKGRGRSRSGKRE
jgi:hypothetical protein